MESVAEAEGLTESDPSIQAVILKMEMKEWYGCAALPLLLDWQSKIAKKEI
ncbi:MAG: hypothetical protein ACI9UV_000128 [Algoriphagus sp.]